MCNMLERFAFLNRQTGSIDLVLDSARSSTSFVLLTGAEIADLSILKMLLNLLFFFFSGDFDATEAADAAAAFSAGRAAAVVVAQRQLPGCSTIHS
jgi:hypothetical protein